jgi:hypothetical protein
VSWFHRKAQLKEEHPSTMYPEMQPVNPRDNPPQGGCATIPIDCYTMADGSMVHFPIGRSGYVPPAGGQSNKAVLVLIKRIEEQL